ncbi:MAG: hypothetical protein HYY93_05435 [Planctomycetes bacterium]|nr:hypothetical protein [Planctomycetota bacterium]
MDALTRMLAIGSRDELAERLAGAYAQAMGADPDALLSQARRAAKDCDLQRGLPFVDPPLTAERFFAEIDR